MSPPFQARFCLILAFVPHLSRTCRLHHPHILQRLPSVHLLPVLAQTSELSEPRDAAVTQCSFIPGPRRPAVLVPLCRTHSCRPISNIQLPAFSLFTSHLPRLEPFHPGVPRSLLATTSAASGLSPSFRTAREHSISFSYCRRMGRNDTFDSIKCQIL